MRYMDIHVWEKCGFLEGGSVWMAYETGDAFACLYNSLV